MKIKYLKETAEGEVTFEANLNPDEVEFLLTYSINNLLSKGIMPFSVNDPAKLIVNYEQKESH